MKYKVSLSWPVSICFLLWLSYYHVVYSLIYFYIDSLFGNSANAIDEVSKMKIHKYFEVFNNMYETKNHMSMSFE